VAHHVASRIIGNLPQRLQIAVGLCGVDGICQRSRARKSVAIGRGSGPAIPSILCLFACAVLVTSKPKSQPGFHPAMNKFLSLLAFSLIAVSLHAASPNVSNVTVSQRAGTKLVDIHYDVSDSDGGPLRVEVQVSSNAGRYYDVPAVSLTGDVGTNLNPGTNKHVVWNAGLDWPGLFSDQMKVRVFAADNNTPAPPPGMVYVPPGPFQMGDNFAEGDADEGPVHTVTLDGYYIEMFEVTNELWNSVVTWALEHGYVFGFGSEGGGVEEPVDLSSWVATVYWCNARSEMEGLTPAYYTDSGRVTVVRSSGQPGPLTNDCVLWSANGYRLPTEAEWEKAARGGLTGKRYPWGDLIDTTRARYGSASPVRVGSYPANGYGVFDVAGNYFDLCWDRYASGYYTAGSSVLNPLGPDTGGSRIIRGGVYADTSQGVRVASRASMSYAAVQSLPYYGFRCVRVPATSQ